MNDWADDAFDALPVVQDGEGALAPYHPETSLPPSPWTADPAPAPDFLTARPETPQQPQPAAADIKSAIAQLPAAQRQQAENAVAMIEDFGRTMLQAGVTQSVIVAAGTWMDRTAGRTPNESKAHSYDLRAFNFSPKDAPFITSFANHMARAGASQADVVRMLDWYQKWEAQRQRSTTRQTRQPAAAAQDFAAQDARDRLHAETVLRDVWGQSYATNIRAINKYLDGLPATERAEIEAATLPSGGLELNNPDILEYLLRKAGSGPSPLAAEIQALESRMRTDRRGWFRDDAAQARLRSLYAQRDGG